MKSREAKLIEDFRKLSPTEQALVNMAAKLYLFPNEKPYKRGNVINMLEWLAYTRKKRVMV